MASVIIASHEIAAFDQLAKRVECWMGQPMAFGVAVCLCIVWAVTGPLFNFSNGWQLVINTATTVVTFLMVFLIQSTTNRSSSAIQLKLDELIRANDNANNAYLTLENLTLEDLDRLKRRYEELAELAKRQTMKQRTLAHDPHFKGRPNHE